MTPLFLAIREYPLEIPRVCHIILVVNYTTILEDYDGREEIT